MRSNQGSRARALYKAGLRTPEAIAEASVPEIVKVLFESSSWADQGEHTMIWDHIDGLLLTPMRMLHVLDGDHYFLCLSMEWSICF